MKDKRLYQDIVNRVKHLFVAEDTTLDVKDNTQLRAELEAAKKTIAEYESRKCDNCSRSDSCDNRVAFYKLDFYQGAYADAALPAFDYSTTLTYCSAFKPKGE